MLATIAFLTAAQAPPGQVFNFSAMFNMTSNVVRLSASRVLKSTPKNRPGGPVTVYPTYRWSVPAGASSVRFIPLSGQTTIPRVTGLTAWPAPSSQGMEIDGTSAESCGIEARVDWKGCVPGFYRLEAASSIHGQDRTWTMTYGHQIFYWRPMPGLKPILTPGQPYLVIGGRMWSTPPAVASRVQKQLGKTLTLVKRTDARFNISAILRSGKETFPLTFMSDQYPPAGIEPVLRDAEADALRRAYVGKRMYPMGLYLDLINEDSEDRLRPLNRGMVSVVIRDVWRAARPRSLGDTDPTILVGGSHRIGVVEGVRRIDADGRGARAGAEGIIVENDVPGKQVHPLDRRVVSHQDRLKGQKTGAGEIVCIPGERIISRCGVLEDALIGAGGVQIVPPRRDHGEKNGERHVRERGVSGRGQVAVRGCINGRHGISIEREAPAQIRTECRVISVAEERSTGVIDHQCIGGFHEN